MICSLMLGREHRYDECTDFGGHMFTPLVYRICRLHKTLLISNLRLFLNVVFFIHKLLNQLFALVSYCSKKLLQFLKLLHLLKY